MSEKVQLQADKWLQDVYDTKQFQGKDMKGWLSVALEKRSKHEGGIMNYIILNNIMVEQSEQFTKYYSELQQDFGEDIQALRNKSYERFEKTDLRQKVDYFRICGSHYNRFKISYIYIHKLLDIVNIDYFKLMMEQQFIYTQENYQQIITLQDYSLDFYYKFHICKDFQHLRRICAKDLKISNPLLRESTRLLNRNNQEIKSKYFISDTDNIVYYTSKALDNLIPANRFYVSSATEGHITILELLLKLFEYGMIKSIEVDNIIQVINRKVQILKNFEAKLKEQQYVSDQHLLQVKIIKNLMSQILLQILFLRNDQKLVNKLLLSTYNTNTNNILDNIDNNNNNNNIHLINEEQEDQTNKNIYYTIFSYMFSNTLIKKDKVLTSDSQEYIESILQILLDNHEQSEDDIYLRGIKLLDISQLKVYQHPDNNNIHQQTILTYYQQLLELHKKFANGLYIHTESQCINEFLNIINNLKSLLENNTGNSLLNIQRIIGDYNLVTLTLQIMLGLHEFGNNEFIVQYNEFLVSLCQGSYECQYELLCQCNFEIYKEFIKTYPGYMLTGFLNIFQEKNFLLYEATSILQYFLYLFAEFDCNFQKNKTRMNIYCLANILDIIYLFIANNKESKSSRFTSNERIIMVQLDELQLIFKEQKKLYFKWSEWISISNIKYWCQDIQFEYDLDMYIQYTPDIFDNTIITDQAISNGYCCQIATNFLRVFNRCHESKHSIWYEVVPDDQKALLIESLNDKIELLPLKSRLMQFLYNQSIFWNFRFYQRSDLNPENTIHSKFKEKQCTLSSLELDYFIKWIQQDLKSLPNILKDVQSTLELEDQVTKKLKLKTYMNFVELAIIVPLLNFILHIALTSQNQKELIEKLHKLTTLKNDVIQHQEDIIKIVFYDNLIAYNYIPESNLIKKFDVDLLDDESKKIYQIGKDIFHLVYKCLYQIDKAKLDEYTFRTSKDILKAETNYVYTKKSNININNNSNKNNIFINSKNSNNFNKVIESSKLIQKFVSNNNHQQQQQQSQNATTQFQNSVIKVKKINAFTKKTNNNSELQEEQPNKIDQEQISLVNEQQQQQQLDPPQDIISQDTRAISPSHTQLSLRYKQNKEQSVQQLSEYLSTLKDDGESYYQNLIEFIIHQIMELGSNVDDISRFVSLINALSILFFNNTASMQSEFLIVYRKLYNNSNNNNSNSKNSNQKQDTFFRVVFEQMMCGLYICLNPFPRGRVWLGHFLVVKFCLIFFKNCCEDNNTEIKLLLRNTKITQKVSLVRATLDLLSKLIESSKILITSLNFTVQEGEGEREQETIQQHNIREDLCELMCYNLDTLTEFLIGPCLPNQLEVHQYLYDELMIILRRPAKNLQNYLYIIKEKVLDYILAISDGYDTKIIEAQSSSIDNVKLNNLMTTYFRVLVKDKILSDKSLGKIVKGKKTNQNSHLTEEYIPIIFQKYQKNTEFNQHILIKICFKIFLLLNTLAIKSSRVKLFLTERDQLIDLEKKKIYSVNRQSGIDDEDLVVHMFFKLIWGTIEIIGPDGSIQKVNYLREPEAYYLSEETKEQFLENANPENAEGKLSELLERSEYFSFEMNYNMHEMSSKSSFYTYFASGKNQFFELILFLLALLVNIVALATLNYQSERDYKNEISNGGILVISAIIALLSLFFSFCWFYIRYPLVVRIKIKEYLFDNPDLQAINTRDLFNIFVLRAFLNSRECLIFVFHFICSILALLFSNIFFTIELLSIMNLFTTMRYLLLNILKRWKLLGVTICLGMLLLFIFTQLLFYHNNDQFLDGNTVCNSLDNCFRFVIFYGIRSTGGIGDVMRQKLSGEDGFYEYFTINMLFFFFINMIIFNLVFGIMIDIFVELREFTSVKEHDLHNVCYICNLDKWDFQKNGISFEKHIKVEHNIWYYAYFLSTLQSKNPKNLNGTELFILQRLKNRDTSWFPFKRSLQLENDYSYTKEEYSMEKMKQSLTEIKDLLTQVINE